jgi:hypothetical protein
MKIPIVVKSKVCPSRRSSLAVALIEAFAIKATTTRSEENLDRKAIASISRVENAQVTVAPSLALLPFVSGTECFSIL